MIKEFYRENHDLEKIIDIEIYTDGSCKGGQFGGWAFMVVQDSRLIYAASGMEYPSTNQRMELTAIAEALDYIAPLRTPHQRVKLYSDSAYAINCYSQKWFQTWQLNGWATSSQKPVANQELWYRIIPFFTHWWFSFFKVKGHADNIWNNRCDKMAQDAAEKCKFEGKITHE